MAPLLSESSSGCRPLLSTRAEREAEAARLRAQGLKLREIAEQMDAAISTVQAWLSDPGGRKLRQRKDSYRGVCDGCGGPTHGSDGPSKPGILCQDCRNWTDDEMVDAMRAWADAHGGIPPTTQDWRHADVDHPSSGSFGRSGHIGWNEALLSCGFALRCDRRPETWEWIIEQVRAGASVEEIAHTLGVSPAAIYNRFRWRGLSVIDVREGLAA